MKVLQRTPEKLVFGLGVREKTLLDKLLGFYPIRPDLRPVLSRQTPGGRLAEAEALLLESLRDRQKELIGWIHERLVDGNALHRTGSGWRLTLRMDEIESFLQVFNELRVGAWQHLGSPDDLDDPALAGSSSQASYHAIMTVAGQFEMVVLLGLEAPAAPEAPAEPQPPTAG